jgi:iron complex transport system substrate-binding protein
MVKKLLSMSKNQPIPMLPRSLAQVWQDMRRTALPEADQVALRRRLLSLQIRTAAVDRKRLLIVESMLPLQAAGYWMPELAELVGGDLVISRKGEAPAPMTLAEVSVAAPDLILVACTGHDLAQNAIVAKAFANDSAPVYAADAINFFCKADERLVATAEILAELLHEDARLHFGHAGKHWQRVSG